MVELGSLVPNYSAKKYLEHNVTMADEPSGVPEASGMLRLP